MSKKKGFTRDQHEQHHAALRAAREAIVTVWQEGMKAYPVDSPQYKAVCKAGKAFDKMLSELERASARDGVETDYHAPHPHQYCGWN